MKALNCPNCGGTVKIIDKTSAYANCPYCSSEVYFKDKDVLNLVSSMRIVEDKLDSKNKDSIKDKKWNLKKKNFYFN